jgi:hypothetical protein
MLEVISNIKQDKFKTNAFFYPFQNLIHNLIKLSILKKIAILFINYIISNNMFINEKIISILFNLISS